MKTLVNGKGYTAAALRTIRQVAARFYRPFWAAAMILMCGMGGFSGGALADRLIAYDIDFNMDKAREETTVDHYGEGIRGIVQDANRNNENHPNSKPTAETTEKRRNSQLSEQLPERRGEGFTKKELVQMDQ